jgi:tetratricopeptide (TPR) repeat protein
MRRLLLLAFIFLSLPRYALAEQNLGSCLEDGDDIKSIRACTAIIQDKSQPAATIARAYSYRGYAYYRKKDGDYKRARSDFDEAIRLDPTQFWYFVRLANVFKMENRYDRSVEILTKAIPLDPSLGYKYRASAYLQKGDYSAAIADYSEHLKRIPTDRDVIKSRAEAYLNAKDYAAAIVDYDTVIKLDPEYAHGYQERGHAYEQMGDFKRAITDFDKAASLPGMIPTGLLFYYRAKAYEKTGDLGRAIVDYEQAIKIDPDYDAARAALRDVRKRLGFKR